MIRVGRGRSLSGAPRRFRDPGAESALRRGVRVLRREGLRAFWFKLLSEFGFYRRLLLLEIVVTQPFPAVAAAVPISCEQLQEFDLDAYCRFRPETGTAHVRDRLRRGQVCYVARHEGRIVSATWVAVGSAPIEYLGLDLPLAPTESYLCDTFTAPAFRGKNIAPGLGSHVLEQLHGAGCRKAIRGTLPENRSALRTHAKIGFRVCGVVAVLRIGPWRRFFRRTAV